MALVSVIMPMKNAALYVEACIESIIEQSYQNWELIVVDDNSTDHSSRIVSSVVEKDNRIRLISNRENGITAALRYGYSLSSGSLVTRMDADDIMPKQKLEELVAVISDGTVATGLVEYFSDDYEVAGGYQRYAKWLNEMCRKQDHFLNIYKECVLPSPCWMMTRSTFDEVGAFDAYAYPEDYDLVFRIYKAKLQIIPVVKVLHLWRDHSNRASRNDSNYSDQSFLPLKLHYFMELDRRSDESLHLWGAGRSGKAVAKELSDRGVEFSWYSDNENKIGHSIYDVVVQDSKMLLSLTSSQVITAIKTPTFELDSADMLARMKRKGLKIFHFH